MVRGRKPTPQVLQLVKGERPDRINTDAPVAEAGIPDCPSTHPDVIAIWDHTMKQLQSMRVMTMADRDMLLAYCQAVYTHNEATRILNDEGLIITGVTGALTTHPASRIQRDSATAMRSIAAEFGLTPAARTRIKVRDQQPAETGQSASRLLSS